MDEGRTSPSEADARARAARIVRAYGREAAAMQALDAGYRTFLAGDDAVVHYVDVAGAWMAAGTPVAAPSRVGAAAAAFASAARANDRLAILFASSVTPGGFVGTLIGEEPYWTPANWPATLASTPSLREQLRRARAKRVTVRALATGERESLRPPLERLISRWRAMRSMAEMAFVARVDAFGARRRLHLAEWAGVPVGLAVVAELPGAAAVSVEALVRDPGAPNGTIELLFDDVIRTARDEGRASLTLGLAPLAGEVPGALRIARSVGRGLYDFDGLRAFKAKLRPERWEPRLLAREPSTGVVTAFHAVLAAFAGGSFLDFGLRTLRGM